MTRALPFPTKRTGRAHLTWLPWVLLAVWASPLWAQSPTAVAATPAPQMLSLSEAMERSEEAHIRLQAIAGKGKPDALAPLQAEVSHLTAQVATLADDTARRLGENPALSILPDLEISWAQVIPDLTRNKEQLAKRAKQQDVLAAEIAQLATDAEQVRAALSALHAPPEVIERDDLLRRAIAAQQHDLLAQQRALLLLRHRVTESLARGEEVMADIDSFSRSRVQRIFAPDTVPLWQQRVLWDGDAAAAALRQTLKDFAQPLLPYLLRSGPKLAAQLLLLVLTALLLRHGRATVATWPRHERLLEQFIAITALPWSAALLASLVTVPLIERDAPRILWMAVGWLAIAAALRVVRRVVDRQRYILVSLLAIYAGVGLARTAFSASAPLLQAFVTAETLLACALLGWIVRRRADRFTSRAAPLVRTYGPWIVVLLAANSILALCGYLDLAQLVVVATLGSAILAVTLAISARIALALCAYLLHVRPLTDLRLVRRNRERILGVITRILIALAAGLWLFLVLRDLRLLEGVRWVLDAIFGARFQAGAISVSLRDLVEFGLTLWISWLLSSFTRFVLDEDIYPRVTLPRGVPYALSTLLHYVILVLGFFVALGVLGIDLTKATILAGALGVGIGFGLQNVVNNFVSGLILLFERPVQVGDTVLIRDVAGEIQHIGIRSCIVRTHDGAEVILPNALLISDPVTNWTLSNRLRRITLSVGVAYGSDPAVVSDLLRGVATAHAGVITSPAPQIVFTGFGDSALTFQLRVWTDRSDQFDSWVMVQSDLYLALHKALTGAGIEIPFPQRDVHIESTAPLPVRIVDTEDPGGRRS